jgi:hypothetical protein
VTFCRLGGSLFRTDPFCALSISLHWGAVC